MNQKLTLAVVLLFWLLTGGSLPRPAAAQDPASQVLQLVNQTRASYGLAPFGYNGQLAAAAQQQANWMAVTGQYLHNHDGSTPQTRASAAGYPGRVSENIVGGTSLTPQQGVVWWQNSPVHFNTMISTRFAEAGVGVASGLDQTFYVLVVGTQSEAAPAAAAALQQVETAAAFVAPIVLAAPREDGSIVHTVQSGHTLWAVAARYEVPIETLLLYNNLSEDSFLQPGDTLLIRLAEGQSPPPTPTPPATHRVREGETAWSIAARYRITLDEILWLNGLTEEAILQPGDEIVIRLLPGQQPPPTPTPQLSHIVQAGDTLWGVALAYNLTLEQLLGYNGLDASALIRIGQELAIRPLPSPTPLPPTATATAAPTQTSAPPTHTPTAAAAQALAPANPTATPPAAPPAAPPQSAPPRPATSFGGAMLAASLMAALGLTTLAAAAILALRRQA